MGNFSRYVKNTGTFSCEEVEFVHGKKVCVVGLGGLGGYVASTLARFGVLNLTVIDMDIFDTTNLNRQIFADESTLGLKKADVCRRELKKINKDVTVNHLSVKLDQNNAAEILKDHDLAVDCLDNVESRLVLENACAKTGLPFVHGAIGGYYGQVATVFPGDFSLKKIYSGSKTGMENKLGIPSFIPLTVAGIQCSEAVKVLLGKSEILRHKLLYLDLYHNDFDVINLI